VELDFRPDTQASRIGASSDIAEIPTVPSPFAGLAQQLETLDVAAVVAGLQRTLASLDALLTNPALGKTIQDLPALIADLRHTAKTVDREATGFSTAAQRALGDSSAALQKTLGSVESFAQNLDRETTSTLVTARATLQSANAAFDSANGLLDPRGETVVQAQRAIDDLAASAARLRNFAERVDRDPAVLVRGR
jgi:paraquat-inducible protein B